MHLLLEPTPHVIFETIAYVSAAALYFILRWRSGRAPFPPVTLFGLIAACLTGAWLGSKLLVLLQSHLFSPAGGSWERLLTDGKSTLGAVLGGWLGIEFIKPRLGLHTPTGEFFVYPLAVAIAIARIGCFMTGLDDPAYGVATRLPWGVNFGDGVVRHPTQLYESFYVILLAVVLHRFAAGRAPDPAGLFRGFVAGYLGFRLLVEFIKPRELLILGLSMTQIVCALALVWLVVRYRLGWGNAGGVAGKAVRAERLR